jgi:hypothetical protein
VRPILYQTSSLDFVVTILRSGFISFFGNAKEVLELVREQHVGLGF